ncbi:MAG: hypothetical protein QW299_04915 [Candidatus Caldarchaeum sp.]
MKTSKTSLEYITNRYSGFFDGLAERTDYQKVLEVVENAVNTAVSEKPLIIKLMTISDAERTVNSFADVYKKLLPPTVVVNLAADLNWILEQARTTIIILWTEANNK